MLTLCVALGGTKTASKRIYVEPKGVVRPAQGCSYTTGGGGDPHVVYVQTDGVREPDIRPMGDANKCAQGNAEASAQDRN
jgi:hypothetical protein